MKGTEFAASDYSLLASRSWFQPAPKHNPQGLHRHKRPRRRTLTGDHRGHRESDRAEKIFAQYVCLCDLCDLLWLIFSVLSCDPQLSQSRSQNIVTKGREEEISQKITEAQRIKQCRKIFAQYVCLCDLCDLLWLIFSALSCEPHPQRNPKSI